MKKVFVSLLMLICVLGLSSCGSATYIENQFYSTETLEEGLIPNLPKPNGDLLYRTGTSIYCDKIYVSSEESPEEYFKRIIDYVHSLDFEMLGTVNWVHRTTGDLFLNDDSYVFKSTKELYEVSVDDYYNDDISNEPYYSIMFTNNEIVQGDYHEPYQHPENEDIYIEGYYEYYFIGTLIRVCMEEKSTIEYSDGIFEYDFYLEVRTNEIIWMDYYYESQN